MIAVNANTGDIAWIHGLEKSAGAIALVMELVEGATLADRIAQGDLKPANIKAAGPRRWCSHPKVAEPGDRIGPETAVSSQ